jgi:hypothetical protein
VSVSEMFDTDGTTLLYKSKFKTPVCEDKICYDVELIFYWNILGDFVKYELIPGKPLTKQRHTPFSDTDYLKLSEILANKYSAFKDLKKVDLTTKITDDNIDGITRATVTSVKEQTIQGAIYSCYTLWHIANGIVADSIQKRTLKRLDKKVADRIIDMDTENADYFLINNFTKENFAEFMPKILCLTKRNKGYLAKNCIEKIPAELLLSPQAQSFFCVQYEKLDYYAQLVLLDKFQNEKISPKFLELLVSDMNKDRTRNDLIISLVCFNANKTDGVIIHQLIHKIINDSIPINKEVLDEIRLAAKSLNSLKSDVKLLVRYFKQKTE